MLDMPGGARAQCHDGSSCRRLAGGRSRGRSGCSGRARLMDTAACGHLPGREKKLLQQCLRRILPACAQTLKNAGAGSDSDTTPAVRWGAEAFLCNPSPGPFQFDVQGYRGGFPTLLYRPETWTKVSNIIFIDTPIGSGFSYATSKEGLKSSDSMAVKKLVIFLKKWLHEHPQFLSNPLYVGGESYCGRHDHTHSCPRNRHIKQRIWRRTAS